MGDFMNLYFDNSSTSFPKPKIVVDDINYFITSIGASPSRGQYNMSLKSSRILFDCRNSICELLNYNKPENIVFTYNATYAFNILLYSLLNSSLFSNKPQILVSKLDHNATYRPLLKLKKQNKIKLDFIDCDDNFFIDTNSLISKITVDTKFIILSNMSNVLGNIHDIKKISHICKERGVFLIIDISQSIGVSNINLGDIYFSAIIFTGHKNLYSTQGIGGFIISDKLLNYCNNHFLGGTGSMSSTLLSKYNMPDYFEVGTINMIGVSSLLSGINYVRSIGINNIYKQKKTILKNIYNKICNINDIIILNNVLLDNQNSNICINYKSMTPDQVAHILDKQFNISVRAGLHCSPYTHMEIGTYPYGCVRISPSIFNSDNDIDALISALHQINKNK